MDWKVTPKRFKKFWQSETQRFWRLGRYHAVIEQIILNSYGPRRPVRLTTTDADAGPLALECLTSPYIRVTRANVYGGTESPDALQALDQTCSTKAHGPLECLEQDDAASPCDVLCVTSPRAADLEPALRQLVAGGTVILVPECTELRAEFGSDFSEPEYYSDRVAKSLSLPIYHYSTRIEKEIEQQRESRQGAFTVLRKA